MHSVILLKCWPGVIYTNNGFLDRFSLIISVAELCMRTVSSFPEAATTLPMIIPYSAWSLISISLHSRCIKHSAILGSLSKCALDLGVNASEKTIVFNLLVEDSRCVSALAFQKDFEQRKKSSGFGRTKNATRLALHKASPYPPCRINNKAFVRYSLLSDLFHLFDGRAGQNAMRPLCSQFTSPFLNESFSIHACNFL